MRKPLILLNVAMVAALLAAIVLGQEILAFGAALVAVPFFAPLGTLGCYRCDFNVLRRYRGPNHSEHGDSWTRQTSLPTAIPHSCPKCGAALLSARSAD